MRGIDPFGNVSGWRGIAALTTSASGAAPSAPSRWIDLNDDGLADEITDAGSTWFDHVITEKSSERVTYTQWVEHWSYIPSYTYTTGRYSDGFGQTYYGSTQRGQALGFGVKPKESKKIISESETNRTR